MTGQQRLIEALDRRAEAGQPALFWLRDDDAVEPTDALSRFLDLTATHGVPATLAVIPEETGVALEAFLDRREGIHVALHGWSHRNYAPASEKKQELGTHRPAALVLAELSTGYGKLSALHGERLVPMRLPPWNPISPDTLPVRGAMATECLSVFGPEQQRRTREMNTHVDVMDWHGTRGGRPADVLFGEIAARMDVMTEGQTMGLLTHHLVHDSAVDEFLAHLFQLTANHSGCRWVSSGELLRG